VKNLSPRVETGIKRDSIVKGLTSLAHLTEASTAASFVLVFEHY